MLDRPGMSYSFTPEFITDIRRRLMRKVQYEIVWDPQHTSSTLSHCNRLFKIIQNQRGRCWNRILNRNPSQTLRPLFHIVKIIAAILDVSIPRSTSGPRLVRGWMSLIVRRQILLKSLQLTGDEGSGLWSHCRGFFDIIAYRRRRLMLSLSLSSSLPAAEWPDFVTRSGKICME